MSKAYSYDNNTKEYLGDVPMQRDQLESKLQGKDIFLTPANSTIIPPLKPKKDRAVCFDKKNNAWVYRVDNRNESYYDNKGNGFTIDFLDETIPQWGLKEIPAKVLLEAKRLEALQAIKQSAEEYRQKLVDAPPYKVAGYQVKAQVAGRIVAAVENDDTPNPEDIDKLSLEAESKGVTEIKLAEAIIKKAKIYEYAALLIDGLEAKAKLAIEQAQALEDIDMILANLKTQADQEFMKIMA